RHRGLRVTSIQQTAFYECRRMTHRNTQITRSRRVTLPLPSARYRHVASASIESVRGVHLVMRNFERGESVRMTEHVLSDVGGDRAWSRNLDGCLLGRWFFILTSAA